MRKYRCLNQNIFEQEAYKIIPLRDEDKYKIMQWRNEQIDILRQKQPLTKIQQEQYFATVVAKLFDEEQPNQILFSYLKNDELIGYGGLVHIDWESRNAEISFLLETEKSTDKKMFVFHWRTFLKLLKKVAIKTLYFKKIYTYAYDIRPQLYVALKEEGFFEAKRIKNAVMINNSPKDVLIHKYTSSQNSISFRYAKEKDVDLYFNWANDPEVRKQSFNKDEISYERHSQWFRNKLKDKQTQMLVFFEDDTLKEIGQVRITSNNENIIGISIDEKFRGKQYASTMLYLSAYLFKQKINKKPIVAYIKKENNASQKSFLKANFVFEKELLFENNLAIKYVF